MSITLGVLKFYFIVNLSDCIFETKIQNLNKHHRSIDECSILT